MESITISLDIDEVQALSSIFYEKNFRFNSIRPTSNFMVALTLAPLADISKRLLNKASNPIEGDGFYSMKLNTSQAATMFLILMNYKGYDTFISLVQNRILAEIDQMFLFSSMYIPAED